MGRHGDGLRVWRGGAVLLAAVMLLAACTGGAGESLELADAPSAPASPAPVATSSPPPTTPALPPETTAGEYQAALTALDERMAAGMADLRRRRSPVGLAAEIADVRALVDAEQSALAALPPPTTVADAHAELQTALADLSVELSVLESEAASQVVCAGDSAVRRLGDSDGAAALREAAARLRESDPREQFTVGESVPAEGRQRNRRGRNGELRPGRRGGAGELRITGGPDSDSLIKLRKGGQGIRNIYVRRNASVTVTDLPDGRYRVFLAQGRDWSKDDSRFTRDCSFHVFDQRLHFRTTSTQYTIYELELLESVFGNASKSDVTPEDFPSCAPARIGSGPMAA